MKTWNETITCPECNEIQEATVTFEDLMPFEVYVHECKGCGYVIGESEWEEYG